MKIYLCNHSLKFLSEACAWYDEWDWHVEAHYPVDLFSQQMFWLVIAGKTQLRLITLMMASFCLSALSSSSKQHNTAGACDTRVQERKPKSKAAIIVINYTCVCPAVLVSAVRKPYSVSNELQQRKVKKYIHASWTFTILFKTVLSCVFV